MRSLRFGPYPAGTLMIDVIFADHNELFHIGMAELLGQADDVYLMAQPQSAEQLLSILGAFIPHVLVLSTTFLPMFPGIEALLQRRRTALLLLAEDDDYVDYVQALRAQGVVCRSIDGPGLIDALRRVARGELFIQDRRDVEEAFRARPDSPQRFQSSDDSSTAAPNLQE